MARKEPWGRTGSGLSALTARSPCAVQIISEERFRQLEKIKTIGSTYMAASGLISISGNLADQTLCSRVSNTRSDDEKSWKHFQQP